MIYAANVQEHSSDFSIIHCRFLTTFFFSQFSPLCIELHEEKGCTVGWVDFGTKGKVRSWFVDLYEITSVTKFWTCRMRFGWRKQVFYGISCRHQRCIWMSPLQNLPRNCWIFLSGQRIKSYGCHEKRRATCRVQFGLRKWAFYQHKWEKMVQF
jgi:hypothetical protein